MEEKDERLDDLEREKACLEEEVRLVKQEGTTHFNQIRQLEQTQRRMADQSQQEIGKCQDTLAQTQGDLQQAQHSLERFILTLMGASCVWDLQSEGTVKMCRYTFT